MLSPVEEKRLELSRGTAAAKKSQFGQFFTPERTARFMADLFFDREGPCRLLDAGAGIGSLSAAFLERWREGRFQMQEVEIEAFEIDKTLIQHLSQTYERFGFKSNFVANIYAEDFIHAASESLSGNIFSREIRKYTHAILNPPYKKINSNSSHRRALREVGIETVNLYSAFVALSVALSCCGGQIVAIIPRSFCNGPYYRPFREYILERAAIRHIHLFESRSKAFKDDDVLQENIIIMLERGGRQDLVRISTSTDDAFSNLATHDHPFEKIVFPSDREKFIHIPSLPSPDCLESAPAISHTLADLGIKVSTGPVVDFRLKKYLRDMPGPADVPLLYPIHFSGHATTWPIKSSKKPNAIERNPETEKWLYPTGCYCVVRRFSSKEEKRRITASVVGVDAFNGATMLGFENHLNVLHENKRGLPEPLAYGLAAFLNTTMVDENFRRFSGHTQVNATDLKLMKFPSRDTLIQLGDWAMTLESFSQEMVDAKLEGLLQ